MYFVPVNYSTELHLRAKANGDRVAISYSKDFPVGYFDDPDNVDRAKPLLVEEFKRYYGCDPK